MENLPLEWTRVEKNRKRKRKSEGQILNCGDDCCASQSIAPFDDLFLSDRQNEVGIAIFCLPDPECKWFQGYFFPGALESDETHLSLLSMDAKDDASGIGMPNKSDFRKPTPLGILAVEQEVDACLGCADEGYRKLAVSIFQHEKANVKASVLSNRIGISDYAGKNDDGRHPIIIPSYATGGDMMRIRSDDNDLRQMHGEKNSKSIQSSLLNFDADRVMTGIETQKYLEKYFKKIVKKVRASDLNAGNDLKPSWKLLPDCAIVLGRMGVCMKK